MTEERKKPLKTLRDGNVKGAIWENESDKGRFHSVTFSRTYKNQNGDYAEASAFSGTDLLKLSKVAERSYDAIRKHRERTQSQTSEYADQQRENAQSKRKSNDKRRG